MTFDVILSFTKNVYLHNVSILRKFYQNQFINKNVLGSDRQKDRYFVRCRRTIDNFTCSWSLLKTGVKAADSLSASSWEIFILSSDKYSNNLNKYIH